MGIFKKIKQFFSTDINPDPTKMAGFVTPHPIKGGAVKMNSKVVVPQGYAFVIGHNGRALDAFREGEYFMSPAVLPECCKKLKIHKMDKKGNIKKKFKADLYFVNLKAFEFEFKAAKTEMGNRAMGIFSAGSEGNVRIVVKEPRDFVASLLNEFAYLRNGEAEKIVKSWVEESVTEVFRKNNFALSELVSNNPMIEAKSKSDVAMMLSKQGLVLENFEFTYFTLPKKYQKEYLDNKKKTQETLKTEQEQENIVENVSTDETEQVQIEKHIEVEKGEDNANAVDNAYMPFGNLTIFEQSNISVEQNNQENNTQKQVAENQEENNSFEAEFTPTYENVEEEQKREENSSEQFVDLDIDNIIKKEENGKRCLKCGETNELDAKKCTVCGNKF